MPFLPPFLCAFFDDGSCACDDDDDCDFDFCDDCGDFDFWFTSPL